MALLFFWHWYSVTYHHSNLMFLALGLSDPDGLVITYMKLSQLCKYLTQKSEREEPHNGKTI